MAAGYFEIPAKTEDELIVATFGAPVTRKGISGFKKARVIHNMGTAYDGIDIQAATDNGVIVSFPGDYSKEEVAQHTVALILACARKVVHIDKVVHEGKWDSITKPEIRKMLPPMY